MTVFVVTRHPGALDWIRSKGIAFDEHIDHLDPQKVSRGDTVIGSLPVHLAAEICARGGRYLNLSLDLPQALRGRELDAHTLEACQARIEEFHVRKVT